jgi:hypothetical protein
MGVEVQLHVLLNSALGRGLTLIQRQLYAAAA